MNRSFASLSLAAVLSAAFFGSSATASGASDTGGPVWTLDLARKTIKNPDPVAVSENALITIKSAGVSATPVVTTNGTTNLFLTISFTDRHDGTTLALGTNFWTRSDIADGTVQCSVELNTEPIKERMADRPLYGEIETLVTIWDRSRSRMLAQNFVRVLNNPYVTNWTTNIVFPTNVVSDLEAKYNTLLGQYDSMTGKVDKTARDLTDEIGRATGQEGLLDGRIEALENATNNYGLLNTNNVWTGESNTFRAITAETGTITNLEAGTLEAGELDITGEEPGIDLPAWTNRWLFPSNAVEEGAEAQTNHFASQEWADERMDGIDESISEVRTAITGIVKGVVLNGVTNTPDLTKESPTNTYVYLDGVLTEDSLSNYVKAVVLNGETNYPHNIPTGEELEVLETGVIDLGDLLPASSESNYVWGVFIGTNDIPTLPYQFDDPDTEYKGWYVDLSSLATADSLVAVETNLQTQITEAVGSISGVVKKIVAPVEDEFGRTSEFMPDANGTVTLTNIMPKSSEQYFVHGVYIGTEPYQPESTNSFWVTLPAYPETNSFATLETLTNATNAVYADLTNQVSEAREYARTNTMVEVSALSDRMENDYELSSVHDADITALSNRVDTLQTNYYTAYALLTITNQNATASNNLAKYFVKLDELGTNILNLRGQLGSATDELWTAIGEIEDHPFFDGNTNGAIWMHQDDAYTNDATQSFMVGQGNDASGNYSFASGEHTISSGEAAFTSGYETEASGEYSFAAGHQAKATNAISFVWNGMATKYGSQGERTFNVNPIGGTYGFFIGEERLGDMMDARATTNDVAELRADFDTATNELYGAIAVVEGQVSTNAAAISTNAAAIAELEAAMSSLAPVIVTPDNKKWTAQGRYAGGQVTHVWVPYTGVYSAPIRVPMPDGRIFEMVGRYADGNTNIVTHAWEEITP